MATYTPNALTITEITPEGEVSTEGGCWTFESDADLQAFFDSLDESYDEVHKTS